jgi:hypothetical protein
MVSDFNINAHRNSAMLNFGAGPFGSGVGGNSSRFEPRDVLVRWRCVIFLRLASRFALDRRYLFFPIDLEPGS